MSKTVKIILAVLAVLAVLANALYFFFWVPAAEWYLRSTRDTSRQMDMKNISLDIMQYELYNKKFPESLSDVKDYLPKYSSREFPTDPLEGIKSEKCEFTYKYELSEDKKTYTLDACMEVERNANQPNNIYRLSETRSE